MSLCVLGMAEEFEKKELHLMLSGQRLPLIQQLSKFLRTDDALRSRKPEIMADAAHVILTRSSRECSGNFYVDEEILRQEGIKDFQDMP